MSSMLNESTPAVSIGDGGVNKWYSEYFKGRSNSRDHFILGDSDKVFEDAGTVIRNVSIEHLLWVNGPGFMPQRETSKLAMEMTVIDFADDVTPVQTPAESVSRYIDISREKVSFKSKRHGLSMYFEMDRMMTEEGKEDFRMFTKKIAVVFRVYAAHVSMKAFLAVDNSDAVWFPQYGLPLQSVTTAQMKREVAEWAEPHKSEAGAFAMIWRYAKAMQSVNGSPPNTIIFNQEKQGLFKFGNKMLSEYYRAGPDGPDRVLGYEEIANIQNMSFRAFPNFPSACFDDAGNPLTMITTESEIGNYFIFRRNCLNGIPVDKYRSDLHAYIDVFSEQKRGLFRIYEQQLNRVSRRWASDGFLHDDHFHILTKQVRQGKKNGDLLDPFVYYDRDLRTYKVCEFIGDMEPAHLANSTFLRKMVGHVLNGFGGAAELRTALTSIASKTVAAHADGELKKHTPTLSNFVRFLSTRLGGKRNPVFDSNRVSKSVVKVTRDAHEKLSDLELQTIVFFENCLWYHDFDEKHTIDVTRAAGTTSPMTKVAFEDDFIAFKRKIGDFVVLDNTTEEQADVYTKLQRHIQNIMVNGMMHTNVVDLSHATTSLFVAVVDYIIAEDTVLGEDGPMEKATKVVTFITDNHLDMMTAKELVDLKFTDFNNTKVKPLLAELKFMTNPTSYPLHTTNVTELTESNDNLHRKVKDLPVAHSSKITHGILTSMATAAIGSGRPGTARPLRFDTGDLKAVRTDRYAAQGDAPAYDVKRGRFTEIENTFYGADTTMGANITWVMDNISDVVERMVALAIIATPIHLDVFETMLLYDIPLPQEYLIVRPWMNYLMSSLILAQGGREMGELLVGHGHTAIGWKVPNKTGDLHSTQWMGAAMWNYKRRCIVRNAFHERMLGGGGHYFFTDAEYDEHVQSSFNTEGEDRPSLLCMVIGMGSQVREDFVGLVNPMWKNDKPHFDSAYYYLERNKFTAISDPAASLLMDPEHRNSNVVCYQGTQRQCGTVDGAPGELTENRGHHGIERASDIDVRAMGQLVKQPVIASF